MLQRSTHEAAVDIPAIPATVQPGETVDWPHPIAGFEEVADPPPAAAPKTKKPAPAVVPAGEEPTQ